VASRLAALGHRQCLLVRNPARAPQLTGAEIVQASYEDGPSMRAALDGVQTLLLVSGYERGRLEQHYSAIDAAVAARVERIVYTSFLSAAPQATFTHAREHFLTEQRIRSIGLRYTSYVPASTWIKPLVGSPVRASFVGPRATAPSPGSLATTWLMWRLLS
jgi:NAD(P)H dehydrogenase (quinone)